MSPDTCEPAHVSLDGGIRSLRLHRGKQLSWYPNTHMKGENPVDALVRELSAYLTQGSWELREDELSLVRQQSTASVPWLALPDCPLICGW